MAKRIYSETAKARMMAKAIQTGNPEVIALAMARVNDQESDKYLNAFDGQQPCAQCPDHISDKLR